MFEYIQKIISRHKPVRLEGKQLTPAAVLVALFIQKEQVHLLLSKRTDTVVRHRGQISFPGGVRETQDHDLVETALREAREEVGIDEKDVRVFGCLDDVVTITDYLVTPVVGSIPFPYDFRINPTEVEELIFVPWAVFANPCRHHREKTIHRGLWVDVDYYGYKQHTIWGATARIARRLIELVENNGFDAKEKR